MPLPNKLKIGPYTYRVSQDRTEMLERCRTEATDLLGHIDHRHLTILIEPTQAETQKQDSLLHEALHAICEMTGLSAEWGEEREEATVRRLSPALLALLRDNPRTITYLTQG